MPCCYAGLRARGCSSVLLPPRPCHVAGRHALCVHSRGGAPFLKVASAFLAIGTSHRVRFSQRLMGSAPPDVTCLGHPVRAYSGNSSLPPWPGLIVRTRVSRRIAFVVLDWHTSAPNTRAGGSHLGAWCCLSSLRGVLCGFLLATCPLRGHCCATSLVVASRASRIRPGARSAPVGLCGHWFSLNGAVGLLCGPPREVSRGA